MKTLLRNLKRRLVWEKKVKLISKFIIKNDFPSKGNNHVGVFVSSWFGTFVPWYSIVQGILLKKFYNKNIIFIIDDLPYSTDRLNPRYQITSLKKVGSILNRMNMVVYLSEQPIISVSESLVKKFSYINTLHDLKTENFDESKNDYYQLFYSQLKDSSSRLTSICNSFDFEYVIVPGGLCFLTGIFRTLLSEKGVRSCTYDSGMKGTFLLSVSGVAAHLDDIPKGVEYIKHFDDDALSSIEYESGEIINQRFAGKDVFSSQVCEDSEKNDFANSILLPLNVNWDSAALDKHVIFENTIQWIVETTKWVLENTEDTIVIRQHPAERFAYAKSCDDYERILNKNFGRNSRVLYIKADDKVNTYEILKQTKLVIVHTSTVAAEAAIYGKSVISVASSYHSKLGYVKSPQDKKQYFNVIRQSLEDSTITQGDAYQNATVSYYVSQKLNWHFPEFLPSDNVDSWLNSDLISIYKMKGTKEVLSAIDSNTPLATIKYKSLNNELN
ncbi:capsular polysaccharide export protein, LipB/KpsS family [Vibrio coralliilyticus]|uniref:capsular polysaccharide export protein, LipB/KpsS family n=1 Tax=Vibrio coralliilyticus TaxID=190893 RepID=UPI0015602EA5|nr:hypothetical protein [Vibrio coralliilyticus]NRF33154.1 hypothetical protein [Vibrio coralliilyticus]NRF55673.1 hypothetical protein [Vibrio coralliilyticus]